MEFSFDFRSLKDPKKRLLLGVLLLAVGIFCMVGLDWNSDVTRENCVEMVVTFDDCKYHSVDGGWDSNSIYLTFQDYSDNLDIHSSCANDRLTQDLMELKSGTKMRIVMNEETRHIYELEVDGSTWLGFEDAINKIEKNMVALEYLGYAALAAGALVFTVTVISLAFEAIKKKIDSRT
ncbi:MAG: hypothetical protein IJZ55_04670 [Lachnospiraceae bacterium]|nr:hypothetical protein [Lachnospiraceae bacterium]